MSAILQQAGFDIIDLMFIIRFVPLVLAGFISTRSKNLIGVVICVLYICVTTVNYLYKDLALNAIFSNPLVFFTAWYIIKHDMHNRRNHRIKFVKKEK